MTFNNESFNDLKVTQKIKNIPYNNISMYSSFPNNIDKLLSMDFSSTSIAQLGKELNEYYELLSLYLSNDVRFSQKVEDFKRVSAKISQYSLTSEDYIILRDALIETQNYLKKITEDELYSEKGVYTALQKAARDFTTKINTIFQDINMKYSSLPQGTVGRVLPDKSINKNYLNEELKKDFDYISLTTGIYVDKTEGPDIKIPEELKGKAVVIKVNVSE